MLHKNEMINTCKDQRPAKSMTSRKKLTTPNYMHRLKMNEIIYAIHTKAIQT